MRKLPARACAFALALGGCATPLSAPADLFTAPERHLGETVRVRGYLKYDGRNQNLFPSLDWREDWRAQRCLHHSARPH